MAEKSMVRRTFTLRPIDVKLFEAIIKRRRPNAARVDSEVLRDLIHEEWERQIAEAQKTSR